MTGLLLLWLSAAAPAPCVAADVAADRVTAARSEADQAFAAALARAGLKPLELGRHVETGPGAGDAHRPGLALVHRRVDDVEGDYVSGEWAPPVPEPVFVADAHGDVLVVRRVETVRHEVVTVCGCAERVCAGGERTAHDGPCTGCGTWQRLLYGPLPTGVKWKGVREVRVKTREVTVVQPPCEAQRVCPPLAGPPPPASDVVPPGPARR